MPTSAHKSYFAEPEPTHFKCLGMRIVFQSGVISRTLRWKKNKYDNKRRKKWRKREEAAAVYRPKTNRFTGSPICYFLLLKNVNVSEKNYETNLWQTTKRGENPTCDRKTTSRFSFVCGSSKCRNKNVPGEDDNNPSRLTSQVWVSIEMEWTLCVHRGLGDTFITFMTG